MKIDLFPLHGSMGQPPLAHLFPSFEDDQGMLERAARACEIPQTREEKEAAILSALSLKTEGDL